MQLITLDSSRGDTYFIYNNVKCINLNCLVKRNLDNIDFKSIAEFLVNCTQLNLCNLASLCYKQRIDYCSDLCLNLLQDVVTQIKLYNPMITFIHLEVTNDLEQDLKPFTKLSLFDKSNDVVYISKILRDILRFVGFIDSQIVTLLQMEPNILQHLPEDLQEYICFENKSSLEQYDKILEILAKK